MDGLWAITDIVRSSNHKPTVRRLVVPGHEHDEKRRRDLTRTGQLHHSPTTMTAMRLPSRQQLAMHRRSMSTLKSSLGQFWYR